MIKLGLERALQLCKPIAQPWKAIHVAGTNGKGSVCAFITNAVRSHGLKCGTFTSPHLIDRWDCIKINASPIQEKIFNSVEDHFKDRNRSEDIGATEFELLTASAFQTFTDQNVDLAVVECGMGGRRDATNILESKEIAVITRVGYDHQEFLGNTLRQIAAEKCGIFQYGNNIIYDHHNDPDVIAEIRYQTHAVHAYPAVPPFSDKIPLKSIKNPNNHYHKELFDQKFGVGSYLSSNALVAYRAAHLFLLRQGFIPNNAVLARSIMATTIPGRMQKVDLEPLVGVSKETLMDGAHNFQAIQQLQQYGLGELRARGPISWVFAFSEGKVLDEMISPLILPGDTVAAVEFGSVEGMPWKKPMPSAQIKEFLDSHNTMQVEVRDFGTQIQEALKWSANVSTTMSVGIIGSLYLASDILKMLRDVGVNIHATDDLPDKKYEPERIQRQNKVNPNPQYVFNEETSEWVELEENDQSDRKEL